LRDCYFQLTISVSTLSFKKNFLLYFIFSNFDPQKFEIMIGTNSLLYSDKDAIIIRPKLTGELKIPWYQRQKDFNNFTLDLDLALLKTSKPIEFLMKNNSFIVNSICLPFAGSEPEGIANFIGWGYTDLRNHSNPDLLQEIVLPIITREECQRVFIQTAVGTPDEDLRYISENMCCAMGSIAPGVLNEKNYEGAFRVECFSMDEKLLFLKH
jgi:hypothetical protein